MLLFLFLTFAPPLETRPLVTRPYGIYLCEDLDVDGQNTYELAATTLEEHGLTLTIHRDTACLNPPRPGQIQVKPATGPVPRSGGAVRAARSHHLTTSNFRIEATIIEVWDTLSVSSAIHELLHAHGIGHSYNPDSPAHSLFPERTDLEGAAWADVEAAFPKYTPSLRELPASYCPVLYVRRKPASKTPSPEASVEGPASSTEPEGQ